MITFSVSWLGPEQAMQVVIQRVNGDFMPPEGYDLKIYEIVLGKMKKLKGR